MTGPCCPHGSKLYAHGYWLCAEGSCAPELAATSGYAAPPDTPRIVPVNKSDWEGAVINCPDVIKTCLAVALAVGRFSTWESGMECRVSQAHIASCVGLGSLNAVGPHLRRLVELGWLHIHREAVFGKAEGHNRPREYWLTVPKCDHLHDGTALPRIPG